MDTLAIASLSMALSQYDLMTKVNVSLMKNSIDSQETVMNQVSEMLSEPMAPIEMGTYVDMSI